MFGEDEPVEAKKAVSNSVYEEDDGETEEEKAANAARRERMAKAAALKADVCFSHTYLLLTPLIKVSYSLIIG